MRGRRRRVFPARASIDVRRDADRRAHRSHHRHGRRLGRRGSAVLRRSYPSSTTARASTGSRPRCSSGSPVTTRVSSESTPRDWRRAFSTATAASASSGSRPQPVCRGNTWRAYFANASALRRRPTAASRGSNRGSLTRAAVESTGRRLAATLGYADQSHMIAEFRRFSSLTPHALAAGGWFHPFIERARARSLPRVQTAPRGRVLPRGLHCRSSIDARQWGSHVRTDTYPRADNLGEPSKTAIKYGVAFARQFNAKLFLVHMLDVKELDAALETERVLETLLPETAASPRSRVQSRSLTTRRARISRSYCRPRKNARPAPSTCCAARRAAPATRSWRARRSSPSSSS